MQTKLIFLDVDGTLADSEGHVPASALDALRRVRAAGHCCFINTGRPYSHIEPAVQQIETDGYICSCGQYIQLQGQVLRRVGFTEEESRRIRKLAAEQGLNVVYEAEEGFWLALTHPDPGLERWAARFAARGFDVYGDPGRFDKFCLWAASDHAAEQFRRAVSPIATGIDRGGGMWEMTKAGCSKAAGLDWVRQYFGAAKQDCYAAGDSPNDIPMLQAVAHGIAMGGSEASVRQAAEYVTDSMEQDGLARALAHYGLFSRDNEVSSCSRTELSSPVEKSE